MASISKYQSKAGETLRAVQFVGADRKRRSIRLGALPLKDVEKFCGNVTSLEAYRKSGDTPAPELIAWLGRVGDDVHATLAAGGLCEARGTVTKGLSLGAYLENYIGQRQSLVAAGKLNADTLRNEKVTRDCLIQCFSADKLLKDFTSGDAEDFRHFLLTKGWQPVKRCGSEIIIMDRKPLSESTTRKRCSMAGKFFRAAVRRELIARNPFDTEAVPKANICTESHAYITAADAWAVMEELPGTQWKVLFGLCRWGGLRIGETRLLTWNDVLWDQRRLLVHSPKTARYHGHAERYVPMFPELEKLLDARHTEAIEGDLYVLPMMQGKSNSAFRKTVQRAVTAAKVTPWPRLWHNLRGTRQNELLEAGFKRKAVCAWLGNSADVADKHYEKSTEADWSRATAPDNAPPAEKVAETAEIS